MTVKGVKQVVFRGEIKQFLINLVNKFPEDEFSTFDLVKEFEKQKGRTIKPTSVRKNVNDLYHKGFIDKMKYVGSPYVYIKKIDQKVLKKRARKSNIINNPGEEKKPKINVKKTKIVKKPKINVKKTKIVKKTPDEIVEISDRFWSCPENHLTLERELLKVGDLIYFICKPCKCAYRKNKWIQYPFKTHNLKDLFFSIIDLHPEFLRLLEEKEGERGAISEKVNIRQDTPIISHTSTLVNIE